MQFLPNGPLGKIKVYYDEDWPALLQKWQLRPSEVTWAILAMTPALEPSRARNGREVDSHALLACLLLMLFYSAVQYDPVERAEWSALMRAAPMQSLRVARERMPTLSAEQHERNETPLP